MHEVELLPLGDTDVTTLGKWLSNHDNMVQCCILLGRAPRTASPSCMQDGDIPSARRAECPGDGSQPVVTEGCACFLPSGHPFPSLVPGGASCGLLSCVLPLTHSEAARDARTSAPGSCQFGSEFLFLSISSHLKQVPLTQGYLFRKSLLF